MDINIKTYVDQRFTDVVSQVNQRFGSLEKNAEILSAANNKAIDVATAAHEKRFDSINEFRGQLSDQAATFVHRDVMDSNIKAIYEKVEGAMKAQEEKIQILQTWKNKQEGATGIGRTLAIVAILISLFAAAITGLTFLGYNHNSPPIQNVAK